MDKLLDVRLPCRRERVATEERHVRRKTRGDRPRTLVHVEVVEPETREIACRLLDGADDDGRERGAALHLDARRLREEHVPDPIVVILLRHERATAVAREQHLPLDRRHDIEACVPARVRHELDLETDAVIVARRHGVGAHDPERERARDRDAFARRSPDVGGFGVVFETELAPIGVPNPSHAPRRRCGRRVRLVREIGVDEDREREPGGLLREICTIEVLVHAATDVAGHAELERVLGDLHPSPIGARAASFGRQRRVVAEPRMLRDVRQRDRQRRVPVDRVRVARQHARLMDEQPAVRLVMNRAVVVAHRQDGPPLARVRDLRPRS